MCGIHTGVGRYLGRIHGTERQTLGVTLNLCAVQCIRGRGLDIRNVFLFLNKQKVKRKHTCERKSSLFVMATSRTSVNMKSASSVSPKHSLTYADSTITSPHRDASPTWASIDGRGRARTAASV